MLCSGYTATNEVEKAGSC